MTESFHVRARPPDDWPGIPGAGWGMGSRVVAAIPGNVVSDRVAGVAVGNSTFAVRGMVVGAIDDGPEEWTITVRGFGGIRWRCLPSWIKSDTRP